jgi:hypothetical protein
MGGFQREISRGAEIREKFQNIVVPRLRQIPRNNYTRAFIL